MITSKFVGMAKSAETNKIMVVNTNTSIKIKPKIRSHNKISNHKCLKHHKVYRINKNVDMARVVKKMVVNMITLKHLSKKLIQKHFTIIHSFKLTVHNYQQTIIKLFYK